MQKLDLTDKKFNFLTYIKDVDFLEYKGKLNKVKRCALFQCDCGKQTIKPIIVVTNGMTKSCGCYNSNLVKERNKKNIKHGLSGTRIWKIYDGIKHRTSSMIKHNKNYALRGIKNEWKSFEEFYNDMNSSYLEHIKMHGEKHTSIDRIDVNKNYSKQNCRWATPKVQNNNTTKTVKLKYLGKLMTLDELELLSGVSKRLIYKRTFELKWDLEKTLSTKNQRNLQNA